MAVTDYNQADALGHVRDVWAPILEKELRESTLWAGLLRDPKYSMADVREGDTLKVSYINKPTSSVRTIGTDADSFDANLVDTTQVDIKINKRAVSAYDISDLAELLSQLDKEDSQIREALLSDVRQQINDYIVSLISPSTSSPDHTVASVADFNLGELSGIRTKAGVAKWKKSGEPWYLLADSTYYSDLLDDTTLGASDVMGAGESPMIQGQFARKRMNFNIIEDDSLSTDTAYAFIPSFMKVLMGSPRFKLSDQHANKKFGYLLSVDVPFGAKQLDDSRVISIEN